MISWLNFEELLIHNPIELINFSKSNIQVALSKKQYIDFFSNKAVYMGLYYDEEMDFCVMFYADPLQSSKSGEMYADGYIDVDMKIYRVKVLSNVSINRFNANFNLLTDTKEFKNKGIPERTVNTSITSYYSTIIKEGNETYLHFSKTSSNNSDWFRAYLVRNGNPNFPNVDVKGNTQYTFSVWLKGTGEHTIYAYPGWTEPWNANKTITLTKEWKLYTFTVLTRSKNELNTKSFMQFFIRSDNAGSEIDLKKPKIEEDSVAASYMPSESEATSVDFPKWNVTKTGMLVSPQVKQITMVQAGALMKCKINNNISGWTDGTTQLNYSGQDFVIDGYGMRGLHNG